MPTISQLPPVADVTPADSIPVSQGGVTRSVSVGALLASTQPAIIESTGVLLGRISLGPGGPEPVAIGTGLLLNNGTLAVSAANVSAFSVTSLSPVATITADDLVAISQNGTDHAISYANLLDGLTIDLAQPATVAADTDTFWVAQGSNTMLRQSFAGLWSWLISKLPSYKQQVVEITADTLLDGTVHNGRLLICSQPVTLNPAPLNMGSGFSCDVLNLSSGNVAFGAGIVTSSGTASLPSGQAATVRVATYSRGTIVFASLSGSTSGEASLIAPGQVSGLTASNQTASSISLGWSGPGSGGPVSSYTVQYRLTGTTAWSTFATGVTATTAMVTGLAAGSAYDFQVFALNGAGAGPASAVISASTAAPADTVISVTWNMVPSGSYAHGAGSIGVNAHIDPATAAVQFGFSTSDTVPPSEWVPATHVNTDLWGSYVSTPASPGTWYVWAQGMDGSKPTVYPTPFTVS